MHSHALFLKISTIVTLPCFRYFIFIFLFFEKNINICTFIHVSLIHFILITLHIFILLLCIGIIAKNIKSQGRGGGG